MDPLLILLAGVLPWLLIFAGSVYLIHLWKKPGPEPAEPVSDPPGS